MKIIKPLFISLFFLHTSCSTLRKTVTYSAISGAAVGGFIGKSASPNRASDNYNIAIGSIIGALITGGLGHYFYQSSNPELALDPVNLKNNRSLPIIMDPNHHMNSFEITPRLIPLGPKKYIDLPKNIPKELQTNAKKQYYKKYKTQEYKLEKNGKNYTVPSFEIIEQGVE